MTGELVILSGDQLGPLTTMFWGSVPVPATGATYGAPGGYRAFSAVSCTVTAAHTTLSCMTAPGSGRGLLWNVTIAGQTSATLTSRPTSYAAPVTGTFTGPGANLAQTYGYEGRQQRGKGAKGAGVTSFCDSASLRRCPALSQPL